jgi:flagellar hook-associated protein 2
MGIASSVGLASGIQTDSIITAMMNLEKTPITALQKKQSVYQSKISSYGSLKSSLSGLQSAVSALKTTSNFAAGYTSTTSNKDILGVSVSSVDSASAGTYKVVVNQLATSAQMTSNTFTANDSTVGAGKIQFKVGDGEKQTVTIDADSTSLEDIANAINDADMDVSASVLKVADNDYRLTLTAKDTGKDIAYTYQESGFTFETTAQAGSTNGETMKSQDFGSATTALGLTGTLSVNGTNIVLSGTETLNYIQSSVDAISGITAAVNYDSRTGQYSLSVTNDANEGDVSLTFRDTTDATGLSHLMDPAATVAAKKALININNIDVERDSNTITDLIGGLTLTLADEDPAETVTVSVKSNYNTAKAKMDSFVEAFNNAMKGLDSLQSYNKDTGSAGSLLGDGTTNILRSGLRRMIFSSFGSSGDVNSLSDLGIEVEETGQISFDSSKFTTAMENSPAEVSNFFTKDETNSKGFAVQFDSYLKGYLDSKEGILAAKIDGYTSSSSRIDKDIEAIQKRLDTREANLRKQYAKLEEVLSNFSNTGSYLTNQLSILSNMTSKF